MASTLKSLERTVLNEIKSLIDHFLCNFEVKITYFSDDRPPIIQFKEK